MPRKSVIALALTAAVGSAFANEVSPDELKNRAIERRAIEAIIWGMPAVNYDLMYQEMQNCVGARPKQAQRARHIFHGAMAAS